MEDIAMALESLRNDVRRSNTPMEESVHAMPLHSYTSVRTVFTYCFLFSTYLASVDNAARHTWLHRSTRSLWATEKAKARGDC